MKEDHFNKAGVAPSRLRNSPQENHLLGIQETAGFEAIHINSACQRIADFVVTVPRYRVSAGVLSLAINQSAHQLPGNIVDGQPPPHCLAAIDMR